LGVNGSGVTILSTVEVEDTFTGLPFSQYTISFLTDDIIRMRYVEIDGQLRKVMVVVKMRGGNHSKDIREYVITEKGVVIIHPRQTDYIGLTTGIPSRLGQRKKPLRNRKRQSRGSVMGAKLKRADRLPDLSNFCTAITEHALCRWPRWREPPTSCVM